MAVETVFPIAMGNEEETGMVVSELYGDALVEPEYMARHLKEFVPDDLLHAGDRRIFFENGSLLYVGGALDHTGMYVDTNIERATPECDDTAEVATYIAAHEDLVVNVAKNYAEKQANASGTNVEVRIQRRSVDSEGNRKGCHDNFGYDEDNNTGGNPDRTRRSLLGLLATRSFMTGAGYINKHGAFRLSQKNDGLLSEDGYGYFGSMMRIAESEVLTGTGRLETRNNDVNISPWTIQARLASVALVMAIGQTELADELPVYNRGTNHVKIAKRLNMLRIDDDGQIVATPLNHEAVDFVQRIVELGQGKLQAYADVPDDYYMMAREMYDYCDDFRAVLKREKPFAVLADRSDAMAKFQYIVRRVERDREAGETREMTDMKARMHDMQYDFIGVDAVPFAPAQVSYGYGYRLRSRGKFRLTPGAETVRAAYHRPPQGTRASVRGGVIRDYDLSTRTVTVDWDRFGIGHRLDALSESFGHVNSTFLPSATRYFLDAHFERRQQK